MVNGVHEVLKWLLNGLFSKIAWPFIHSIDGKKDLRMLPMQLRSAPTHCRRRRRLTQGIEW